MSKTHQFFGERNDAQGMQLGVCRANTMRHLLHFVGRGQCRRVFICFPDPHFKRSTHRRRIVSPTLLDEYMFVLRPGGLLYTITDVEDTHAWMRDHGDEHPGFRRVPAAALEGDPYVEAMCNTAEGKKSRIEGRPHLVAVFERLSDAESDARAASLPFFGAYYGGVAVPRDERPGVAPADVPRSAGGGGGGDEL
jgi:tRNA (guanine-N(7)-)-methyltransferase